MPKPSPRNRIVRTALECAGALAFILAGTAVSNADPTVSGQVEHFVSCFGLMITDPVAHEAECGPGVPAVYDPVSKSAPKPAPLVTYTLTNTFD